MIKNIIQRYDDIVQIDFHKNPDYISCRVEYSVGGKEWKHADIYPFMDYENLLNYPHYLWYEAEMSGIVRLWGMPSDTVFWNSHLNLGNYAGKVELRIEFVTVKDAYFESASLELKNSGVVYIEDWERYIPEGKPADDSCRAEAAGESRTARWKTENGCLTICKGGSRLAPLEIPLSGLKGKHDIVFCLNGDPLNMIAGIGEKAGWRTHTGSEGGNCYTGPVAWMRGSEVLWRQGVEMGAGKETGGDSIFIEPMGFILDTYHSFGKIRYIKLIPCNAGAAGKISGSPEIYLGKYKNSLKTGYLIMDAELGDYCYLLGDTDKKTAETANNMIFREFLRAGADEITYASIRIGSKSEYDSKIVQRMGGGKISSDENIEAEIKFRDYDWLKMAMEYKKKYLSDKNTIISAYIGMNRPYVGTDSTDKFVNENPRLLKRGYLDYTKPQVMDYAIAIIAEIMGKTDYDGMIFDFMRTYTNQTVETLVDLFSEGRRILDAKSIGKERLSLKARIPGERPEFYKAVKICAEKGIIDGVIPSNSAETYPLPPVGHYLEIGRKTGMKVYGCIDGWKHIIGSDPRMGAIQLLNTPADLKGCFDHYNSLGVDGIFVYQADGYTGNIFLSDMFGG